MKYLFFTLFFMIATISYGQQEQSAADTEIQMIKFQGPKSCKDIQKDATEMAARKEFVYVTYGLMGNPMSGYPNFVNLLLHKYHIKLESKGCAVNQEVICYAKFMNAAIEKEYGSDFMNQQFQSFLNTTEKE